MKYIFYFTLVICQFTIAQQSFLSLKIDAKTTDKTINEAYVIQNPIDETFFIFLKEPKVAYGYHFDKNKTLKSSLVAKDSKRKYKHIIGHAVKDRQVLLLKSNRNKDRFAVTIYNFDEGVTIEKELDIKLINENFIESYQFNDKCYFYIFNNLKYFRRVEIDIDGNFKEKRFSINKQISQFDIEPMVFYNSISDFDDMLMTKIDNTLPNNLEITCDYNKMYEYDDGFIWTFDKNENHTILLDFDINHIEPKLEIIEKAELKGENTKSNSYIFEEYIAQIVSNNNEMQLNIKDISDFSDIKIFKVKKQDTITFKNTPILQEGSLYSSSTRRMEKTAKFLRKISSDKNGVSFLKTAQGYHAIIGGTREQGGGAPMMMPGFGGLPIAQFGAMTMSFNPAGFAYGSYASLGSTRIESLFNENFEHQEGKIPTNVFDKINDYEDGLSESIQAQTVFKIGNIVFYGFYQPAVKTYELIEFE